MADLIITTDQRDQMLAKTAGLVALVNTVLSANVTPPADPAPTPDPTPPAPAPNDYLDVSSPTSKALLDANGVRWTRAPWPLDAHGQPAFFANGSTAFAPRYLRAVLQDGVVYGKDWNAQWFALTASGATFNTTVTVRDPLA